MIIAFIIIFLFASNLIHSVAVDQQLGFNPYPFGTTIMCTILHVPLLILSIWYLGWLVGILLFLCHLFGLVHATVSWIFNIPELFAKNEYQTLQFMKTKVALLTPTIIGTVIFLVMSFFLSKFKILIEIIKQSPSYIIAAVITIIILTVIRIFVARSASSAK